MAALKCLQLGEFFISVTESGSLECYDDALSIDTTSTSVSYEINNCINIAENIAGPLDITQIVLCKR